jgi:hypothetical protein
MSNKIHTEKGIALVAVMSILLLITLLTLSIITTSKTCALRSAGANINARSMLLNESAANRIYWMLMHDRKNFSDRTLGETDYNDTESERFLADGVKHEFDYYGSKVRYQIYDMQSGISLDGRQPNREIKQLSQQLYLDDDKKNALDTLSNRLLDYIDKDDLIRVNSFENSNYRELNLYNIPRNNVFKIREEVLYIPGSEILFPIDNIGRLSSAKLIAPQGLRQLNTSRLNFFNTPIATIAHRANLSSIEREAVVAALNAWFLHRIPLSQSLDATLIATLKKHFSFVESGYYTIIVQTSPNTAGNGSSPLVISMKINNSIPLKGRNFYEWTIY